MRGMAGPTMVWLIEATSMPSMSAMKMLRVARSRPGAVPLGRPRSPSVGCVGCDGVRGYPLGSLWHAVDGTPISAVTAKLQSMH